MIKEFDNIIRDFASENNLSYIDIYSVFDGKEETLLIDGEHPNSDGHKLIFDKILGFLETQDYW